MQATRIVHRGSRTGQVTANAVCPRLPVRALESEGSGQRADALPPDETCAVSNAARLPLPPALAPAVVSGGLILSGSDPVSVTATGERHLEGVGNTIRKPFS
jgi:hypothetical protein